MRCGSKPSRVWRLAHSGHGTAVASEEARVLNPYIAQERRDVKRRRNREAGRDHEMPPLAKRSGRRGLPPKSTRGKRRFLKSVGEPAWRREACGWTTRCLTSNGPHPFRILSRNASIGSRSSGWRIWSEKSGSRSHSSFPHPLTSIPQSFWYSAGYRSSRSGTTVKPIGSASSIERCW